MIEGLFDFKKTPLRERKELSTMSKRCIEMALVAFPELKHLDKTDMAKGFLANVVKNQGWELSDKSQLRFLKKVSGIDDSAVSELSIKK